MALHHLRTQISFLHLLTCTCALTFQAHEAFTATESPQTNPPHARFLIHTNNLSQAIDIYRQHYAQEGKHDFDLLQEMGLLLLDQGSQSRDREIQLYTIFGAGISSHDQALYILEEGLKSEEPLLQVVSLNLLTRYQTNATDSALEKAMGSNQLLIRIEAAHQIAQKNLPNATGKIESLMHKVDPQLLSLFPPLYAEMGSAPAIKILRKLLVNSNEQVRIIAILSAAKYKRDDLLPALRTLATHHIPGQQEACAFAFGVLKDEASVAQLEANSKSDSPILRLTAQHALYKLGRVEKKEELFNAAKTGDLFAINILGTLPNSEEALFQLTSSSNTQIKFNAAIALLEKHDSRCLPYLNNLLIKDSRDLAISRISSMSGTLFAWKIITSAKESLQNNPVFYEISLNIRELLLRKSRELPEKDFLQLADHIFNAQQNDLVPTLVELLENIRTPATLDLLKKQRQKAGAPLIRNYCNLALYRLKEEGPYAENLITWLSSSQKEDLIQFRPFIPWELRDSEASYQITPHETSRLLIESFEALATNRDDKGIEALLNTIQNGNAKTKYALAGLLIRVSE